MIRPIYFFRLLILFLFTSSELLISSNFKLKISSSCLGDVFLRYIIRADSGREVATTPYLPVGTGEFQLQEPRSELTLATLTKNGAWSIHDDCTSYSKLWLVRFDEAAGQPILDGGSQSSGSLSDELAEQRRFFVRDLRWVTAAIVTILDLREERRGAAHLRRRCLCRHR